MAHRERRRLVRSRVPSAPPVPTYEVSARAHRTSYLYVRTQRTGGRLSVGKLQSRHHGCRRPRVGRLGTGPRFAAGRKGRAVQHQLSPAGQRCIRDFAHHHGRRRVQRSRRRESLHAVPGRAGGTSGAVCEQSVCRRPRRHRQRRTGNTGQDPHGARAVAAGRPCAGGRPRTAGPVGPPTRSGYDRHVPADGPVERSTRRCLANAGRYVAGRIVQSLASGMPRRILVLDRTEVLAQPPLPRVSTARRPGELAGHWTSRRHSAEPRRGRIRFRPSVGGLGRMRGRSARKKAASRCSPRSSNSNALPCRQQTCHA